MSDPSPKHLVDDLLKQHRALRAAHREDPRYAVEAYRFVCEAMDFTCRRLGGRRDIRGRELLDGICDLALERFGFLARTVFAQWGITRTDHFGDIVFTLVGVGLLGRGARDSKADFRDVYPLRQVLDDRFRIEPEDLAPPDFQESGA
ncbi:MAG: Minf_1886 family protein [bacterium]